MSEKDQLEVAKEENVETVNDAAVKEEPQADMKAGPGQMEEIPEYPFYRFERTSTEGIAGSSDLTLSTFIKKPFKSEREGMMDLFKIKVVTKIAVKDSEFDEQPQEVIGQLTQRHLSFCMRTAIFVEKPSEEMEKELGDSFQFVATAGKNEIQFIY